MKTVVYIGYKVLTAVVMESVYFCDTTPTFNGLYGVISQNKELFQDGYRLILGTIPTFTSRD
jgi:hypothetical protein